MRASVDRLTSQLRSSSSLSIQLEEARNRVSGLEGALGDEHGQLERCRAEADGLRMKLEEADAERERLRTVLMRGVWYTEAARGEERPA